MVRLRVFIETLGWLGVLGEGPFGGPHGGPGWGLLMELPGDE